MAYFAIYCADSAEGTRLRKEHHDDHIKHMGQYIKQLMLAGPCPPMEGQERQASFLVVEATDAAALKVGLGNVQVEYLVLGLDGSRHIGDALKGAYLDDLPINRYLLMFVMLRVQQ